MSLCVTKTAREERSNDEECRKNHEVSEKLSKSIKCYARMNFPVRPMPLVGGIFVRLYRLYVFQFQHPEHSRTIQWRLKIPKYLSVLFNLRLVAPFLEGFKS